MNYYKNLRTCLELHHIEGIGYYVEPSVILAALPEQTRQFCFV